ncbi:MAG TPA: histidine--tRNA ligase [Acidimicrobiales bacterium]|nr:histidine--tRNA ligase [Acidimicrobiales bacterium]
MAAPKFRAPQGTHDTLPPESRRWEALVATFAGAVGRAGYGLVQSPTFEDLGVFERVGEGTDIVTKEMYDFEDKGGRHIALRPEGTAPVVRAYLEHRPTDPWKVWYAAPTFRYERPQAGRYRQHHQLGVEVLGTVDPDVDVEVIGLAWDFLATVGLRRVKLLVNSMGEPEDRVRYAGILQGWFRDRLGDLAEEDREKVDRHPLRVLDSKRPATAAVVAEAPGPADHLSDEATAHFERVRAGLTSLGIPFTVEPRLVRGLDYYTRTTFELQAEALDSAQNAVGGGGRYDGLAEALGGPSTPGIGFGMGIERILLAADAEEAWPVPDPPLDVFVVDVTGGDVARDLTAVLRRAGLGADRAFGGRSMKSQMKAADRSGARFAAIVGEDEAAAGVVTLRPLRHAGEQADQQQVPAAELIETVRRLTTDE